MRHCCLTLIYTTGYKVSCRIARLRYLVTHVPRTSLKSNMFLISSTCFFQDPSLDSPFSFAISQRGGGRNIRDAAGGSPRSSHPAPKKTKQKKKRREKKSSALLYFASGFQAVCQCRQCCFLSPCMQPGKPNEGRYVLPREVI